MKLRWLKNKDGSLTLQYLTEYDYWYELPVKTQEEYNQQEEIGKRTNKRKFKK